MSAKKPRPLRDRKIVVAVTSAALEAIDRKARRAHKTRADFVRDLLNEAWRKRYPKKRSPAAVAVPPSPLPATDGSGMDTGDAG